MTGVLDPVAHDLRSRIAGLIFWLVLPTLAVCVVVSATSTFVHRIHARPYGTEGTYVAQLRSCQGNNGCQVAGTFTSVDGLYTVPNVLGDYRWQVGEKHQVVLNPFSEIIALPAQWNPVATVTGGAAGLVYLIFWAAFLIMWASRRFRSPPTGRAAATAGTR